MRGSVFPTQTGKRPSWLGFVTAILIFVVPFHSIAAAQPTEVKIGYLRGPLSRTMISLLDVPAANEGLAGAQLAIADNNTTGSFTGQRFLLVDAEFNPDDDGDAAIKSLAEQGVSLVLTAVAADDLLKLSNAAKSRSSMLLLNISAQDDSLREQQCRANVVHVAPSRAMLADALAQYLVWKKWRRWALVTGSHTGDKLLGEAFRRSATRFGAKIVAEREFTDSGGARRSDSGLSEVQRQMPTLTQGLGDYDVLLAADENEVFAGYLPYRTWDARPVAGSAGLVPTSWNGAFDQWGAVQLQNRFMKSFQRGMRPLDAQAWTAVRMIGEAAARAGNTDANALIKYIKGPEFSVAAFKGQKLTLRDWNLQLRQPILLFDGRNTVSVSPQEGFLHPVSALDTLGPDRAETACKLER